MFGGCTVMNSYASRAKDNETMERWMFECRGYTHTRVAMSAVRQTVCTDARTLGHEHVPYNAAGFTSRRTMVLRHQQNLSCHCHIVESWTYSTGAVRPSRAFPFIAKRGQHAHFPSAQQ